MEKLRLKALHRYYKITRFYSFLKKMSIRGGLTFIALIALVVVLEIFFLDLNAMLEAFVKAYPPLSVFSFFLVSETILGMIPPEIFIAWCYKSPDPWWYLFILSTMSYLGGIFAYFLGHFLAKIPSVKNYLENKIARHIVNLRKWGGLLIFIGAMFPLPHAIVSTACGLIKYNFFYYLLWALFRYVRFFLYAAVLYKIL
ncbi:MAG: short-chain dehydrogenase [Bacteroidetes bacterium RIFOXYA12_FULL_35_11]|nr:MAG: short-chain dehydrogenase [Bacteroidetes bacterium GWF2_35_48]OFY72924.1 MAG: short-chain dehydrogenase [Bacteroidetes bacterium RIFOXYA12_FULL_35_11]OFY99746.1 MAG: short-chain dehydrogenase [Bacteroidetes bacterium RIFOXYC12_FULL_35_7]HBX51965.1 short-chain dehydrogenase [Bacteroidales bacterium]